MSDTINRTADAVLTNHRLVREGGDVWTCVHCKRTVPFGQPSPTPVEPCIPRRWSDQP